MVHWLGCLLIAHLEVGQRAQSHSSAARQIYQRVHSELRQLLAVRPYLWLAYILVGIATKFILKSLQISQSLSPNKKQKAIEQAMTRYAELLREILPSLSIQLVQLLRYLEDFFLLGT